MRLNLMRATLTGALGGSTLAVPEKTVSCGFLFVAKFTPGLQRINFSRRTMSFEVQTATEDELCPSAGSGR